MRATIWTGACAAIVSVATAGILAQAAQTQTPTPAPQTPATQSSPSSSDEKITVTGCLRAAPQVTGDVTTTPGPTGTAGTATSSPTGTAGATDAAGASDQKFVLTGASASPSDATAAAQTYRLIANPTALTAHVGKKLELTGTIDRNSTADPKDPSASAPALRVESGKIVAASCPE